MDDLLARFGRWLTNEIELREWRPADFAREAKVPAQNVSRWIAGTAKPTPASARKIAKALRVPPDDVLVRTGNREADDGMRASASPVESLKNLLPQLPISVPVYDQPVSAGRGTPSLQEYMYLPPTIGARSNWYGLPVRGECMVPELFPGDIVVIDPDGVPESRDMVVAEVDDEQALVKWFMRRRGVPYLEPEVGDPIPFEQERMRIIGVVRHAGADARHGQHDPARDLA